MWASSNPVHSTLKAIRCYISMYFVRYNNNELYKHFCFCDMQVHEERAKLQHFLSELAILGSLQVGFS